MSAQVDSLIGHRVALRRATAEDAPRFREIMATPEVDRWWAGGWPSLEDDLAGAEHTSFAIEADGTVVGMIQWYEETSPTVRYAGLDMFLHPDHHRRGYGSDAIRTLIVWLFDDVGHHRIIIDPALENRAAIACYESVGFRAVGTMRQYETISGGGRRDALFMELVAPDFVRGPSLT
ncbi:GNAT family protein [Rhodococcus sp. ABRD24]|uniref:GNAT family N-acetyltransferase n=1 Tax=Rhodococcus sp. ABRD24 TaxID=2507582 RepID=UPI0013F17D2C|nr:GNAT family protein [Rhodococcus sp. ABRD24]